MVYAPVFIEPASGPAIEEVELERSLHAPAKALIQTAAVGLTADGRLPAHSVIAELAGEGEWDDRVARERIHTEDGHQAHRVDLELGVFAVLDAGLDIGGFSAVLRPAEARADVELADVRNVVDRYVELSRQHPAAIIAER